MNLEKERQYLKDELLQLQKELEQSLEGNLNKKAGFYYHAYAQKQVSIQKDIALIKQLCRKKYVQTRIRYLEQMLKHFKEADFLSHQNLLAKLPQTYSGLPRSYFYHPSVEKWQGSPAPKNTWAPEALLYKTTNGLAVRSKSERTIAEYLDNYQIPYHYETILNFDVRKTSPDFLIKHPYTGKIYIWEHFGALHLEKYPEAMNQKILTYIANGYRPGHNLICTYEYHITDPLQLDDLIQQFFG